MNEKLKDFCLGWFQEMIDFPLTTRIQGEAMEGLLVVEVIQMEDDRLILEGP